MDLDCELNKPLCKRKLSYQKGEFVKPKMCPLSEKPVCPLAQPKCPLLPKDENPCPIRKMFGQNGGQKCPLAQGACPCDPNPPCPLAYEDTVITGKDEDCTKDKVIQAPAEGYPVYEHGSNNIKASAIKRRNIACPCYPKTAASSEKSLQSTFSDKSVNTSETMINGVERLYGFKEKNLNVPDCSLSTVRPLPCSKCLGDLLLDPEIPLEGKTYPKHCPYTKITNMCDDKCLCDDVAAIDTGPSCPFAPKPCPCCAVARCPFTRVADCPTVTKMAVCCCCCSSNPVQNCGGGCCPILGCGTKKCCPAKTTTGIGKGAAAADAADVSRKKGDENSKGKRDDDKFSKDGDDDDDDGGCCPPKSCGGCCPPKSCGGCCPPKSCGGCCPPKSCKCCCPPVVPPPCDSGIPSLCRMHKNPPLPTKRPLKCNCFEDPTKCPLVPGVYPTCPLQSCPPCAPSTCANLPKDMPLAEPQLPPCTDDEIPTVMVPPNLLHNIDNTLDELKRMWCTCKTPPAAQQVNMVATTVAQKPIAPPEPKCLTPGDGIECPLECPCEPKRSFHVPTCTKKRPSGFKPYPQTDNEGEMVCPFYPKDCPLGCVCPYPVPSKELPESMKTKNLLKDVDLNANACPCDELTAVKAKPVLQKTAAATKQSACPCTDVTKLAVKQATADKRTVSASNCPLDKMLNKKKACPFSPAPCPLDPIKPLSFKTPKACPFAREPTCPLMPRPLCPPTPRCLIKSEPPMPACPYAPPGCPMAPIKTCPPVAGVNYSCPCPQPKPCCCCPCPPKPSCSKPPNCCNSDPSDCPCPPDPCCCSAPPKCPQPDPCCCSEPPKCPQPDPCCCSEPPKCPQPDPCCCPEPNPCSCVEPPISVCPELDPSRCPLPDNDPDCTCPDPTPKCPCSTPRSHSPPTKRKLPPATDNQKCPCPEQTPKCPISPKVTKDVGGKTPELNNATKTLLNSFQENNNNSCPCSNTNDPDKCPMDGPALDNLRCPCVQKESQPQTGQIGEVIESLQKKSKQGLNCAIKIPACEKFPEGRCPMEDLNLCDCDYPCPPCMAPPQCENTIAPKQYCVKKVCCMGLPLPPTVPDILMDSDKPIIYYKFEPTKPDREETKYYVKFMDEPPNPFPFGQPKQRENPNWNIIQAGKGYERCKTVADKLKKRTSNVDDGSQFNARDNPLDPETKLILENQENRARFERDKDRQYTADD